MSLAKTAMSRSICVVYEGKDQLAFKNIIDWYNWDFLIMPNKHLPSYGELLNTMNENTMKNQLGFRTHAKSGSFNVWIWS
jgi:hypothetical protein